ncbi:FMN-binding protein [Actinacidiphila bryophytorum]|uniref:FMN-binding protein n=1 Tax=Actinacidiphila bryophytorum TaxID=1436133 RepID=UPI002176C950|nr:FMN-binding protein [Actinacidiphila bryophytorum]UWE11010.1 FMN-binding protein [Actinacidiphila bryophytorum]
MNSPTRRPLRRILLSTLATATGLLLLLSLKPHTTGGAAVAAGAPAPSPSPTAGSGTGAGTGTGSASGTRTVEGDTVQTRYGPVQVRVTLQGGRITAVTAVQVPQDSPRDQEITGFAVPQLTQEALAAQSAHIDTVSGATYTSEGYVQSLQSALDRSGG